MYSTNLHMASGEAAVLFSAQDQQTVATHAQWAQQYGIDGFFLQRFVSELTIPSMLTVRNKVLSSLCAASEATGRTFAIMYDLSGAPESTLYDVLTQDWSWIIHQGYTSSPAYQLHNGRPVLCIWGWGFSDRTQNLTLALSLLSHLRNTSPFPTTMAGVPFYWRTGNKDAQPDWGPLFSSPDLDIVSPWAVGRYNSNSAYDALFKSQVMGDMTALKGIKDYAPVVWPGFSWANLQNQAANYNQIPRNCGDFFTHQASLLVQSGGPLFLYIAMFDEVNEGTAIFKAAATHADTPIDGRFTYLGLDPCGAVPSDHYLTLAGKFYKR